MYHYKYVWMLIILTDLVYLNNIVDFHIVPMFIAEIYYHHLKPLLSWFRINCIKAELKITIRKKTCLSQ